MNAFESHVPPNVRSCSVFLPCQRELDLAFVLADLLDAHVDRVAEPKGPTSTPPHEPGLDGVDLVVVAREAPRGQVALEDIAEADEEPGADHPRDLAGERLLPA